MKELTKDNLCETVPIGSSEKSGRVNTNVDTPNGNLFDDYLPNPKFLKTNLSIDSSDDMAQLENCLNVIQDSLESNITNGQPTELCNKVDSSKGQSTVAKDIESVHCVSLESLRVEQPMMISDRDLNNTKPMIKGHSKSQSKAHVKHEIVESKKVENISIEHSKVLCQNGEMETVSLGNPLITKDLCGTKTNHSRTVDRKKSCVYGKAKKCHVSQYYGVHEKSEKENARALTKNNKVANGSCTTLSKAADFNSKLVLANGYDKYSTNMKANGYISINDSNYIEIIYESGENELKQSNSINGKLPNGNSHIMEDSPSHKNRGRGSNLSQILI